VHALRFPRLYPPGNWSRLAPSAARMVLFSWACFWLWFGLSSGLSAHLHPLATTLHVAAPAAVFAFIALLSLRHPRAAAWILLAFAAAILLEYNHLMGHRGALYVLQAGSIISGPPLLSALLFLLPDRS
jgi:hypothetical protein